MHWASEDEFYIDDFILLIFIEVVSFIHVHFILSALYRKEYHIG